MAALDCPTLCSALPLDLDEVIAIEVKPRWKCLSDTILWRYYGIVILPSGFGPPIDAFNSGPKSR